MATPRKTTPHKKAGRPAHQSGPGVYELLDRYEGSGTIVELCRYLGISTKAFYDFQDNDPKFLDAIHRIRTRADDAVENAFFKRSIGYDYTETSEKTEDSEKGTKTSNSVVHKHMPPDVTAAYHWLRNRRPEFWRDRKEIEITGDHATMVEKLLAAIESGEEPADEE